MVYISNCYFLSHIYIIHLAKVSAMICDYFAESVQAVSRVNRKSYCVSLNRLEVSKILYHYLVVIYVYY